MDLDKKKKLEELRKRLQSMPEEEFKSLLDTSDDKPQGYWDRIVNCDYSIASRGLKAYVESTKKKVYVIKDGSHIATYNNIKEASENLPVCFASIQGILDPDNVLVSANGYTFCTGETFDWSNVPEVKSREERGLEKARAANRPINIYDIDNNFITQVPSMVDAENYTGVTLPAIHSAANKKPRKMWRRGNNGVKYMFEYANKQ